MSNTSLEDVGGTGIDESKVKVGDLFTIKGNTVKDGTATRDGALYVESKNKGLAAAASVDLYRDGAKLTATSPTLAQGVAAAACDDPEKHVVAAGTNNFSAGDEFKLSGKLSDGQEFNVTLVAGKDFAIGSDYKTTITNIKNALNNGINAEGKANTIKVDVDGKKIDSSKIFGATNTNKDKEFLVSDDSNGVLTIESTKAGPAGVKGVTNTISSISVKPLGQAESEYTAQAATAKQAATAEISFDKNTPYGTAIQIGDNTYEIVSDARNVTDRRNVAVVIDDIANASTADIAAALKDAVDKEEGATGTGKYTVTAQGNKVTVTSTDKGSDVEAIKVDFPYGDEKTTAKFQFDPKAVTEGATLKFGGNTYEFVGADGKTTTDGAIAIKVDDYKNATAKELGDAFAAVVKGGVADVAADGTITLSALPGEDGTISTPTVTFANNLTLQIGDTSDSYNQLRVNLSDMHTTAMGIDSVDIGTQEGAAAAIDVIKNAINYVSGVRGDLGAIQNRLDHTANNLSVMAENIQDAESTIRDTDVAEEMMSYVKNNILVQSAQAMLAQANQVPQGVLQLLG